MNKILYLGKIHEGNRFLKVFCKVELENGKLSISGVIEPRPNGNAWGSCGQIYDEIKDGIFTIWGKGWNRKKANEFIAIWKEWHLNDMKAGTPKQEKAIKEWEKRGNKYEYEKAVKYLKSKRIYKDKGYKYGTAWLKVELPAEVVAYINNLPISELKPTWV